VAIKAAGQEDKEPKRVPAAKAKPVVSEVKPVKDNHQSDEPSRVEPVKEKSSVAVPNQTVVKSDNAPRVSGSHVEDAPKPRNTRKIVTRVLASIVGLIVIVIVVFGVLIYGYRSE
jgi:TRAP-type mannitol/chloroaromatic compound transport system permease large subunit